MPTFTTHSPRWALFSAVADALASAPALQGVPVLRNPRNASALSKGEHLVVVKWGADSLLEKPGQIERRRFRLLIGSIARTSQADADADALHHAVGEVVRGATTALAAAGRAVVLSETDITPDVEGLEVDGALVMSSWDVQYQTPKPAR